MEDVLRPFLLVILATVFAAVCLYLLIVWLYETRMKKRHAIAEEIFAKTADLNLRVEVAKNEDLFKREKNN